MITEQEAKTKICPFTFAVPEQRASDGCGIREGGPWPCIASGCMAWRWAAFFKNSHTGEAPMAEGSYDVGTAAECGYCGLAGHPNPLFMVPG